MELGSKPSFMRLRIFNHRIEVRESIHVFFFWTQCSPKEEFRILRNQEAVGPRVGTHARVSLCTWTCRLNKAPFDAILRSQQKIGIVWMGTSLSLLRRRVASRIESETKVASRIEGSETKKRMPFERIVPGSIPNSSCFLFPRA